MNLLLILFPNQLFEDKYINKILKENDKLHIILWEHDYFFKRYKYHKMKLTFHVVTMQEYFDNLDYEKIYIKNVDKNHKKIIKDYIKKKNIEQILFFNPIEKELIKLVKTYKSKILLSPYFLNSYLDNNDNILNNISSVRHDVFYKYQRIKLKIMINKNNKPEGNKWSFDHSNRESFGKIDKINNSNRPIITGEITKKTAFTYAAILFTLIQILNITFLPFSLQQITNFIIFITFIYTPILKKIPFIKNISCALLISFSVIFNGMSTIYKNSKINDKNFILLLITTKLIFFGSLYNELLFIFVIVFTNPLIHFFCFFLSWYTFFKWIIKNLKSYIFIYNFYFII